MVLKDGEIMCCPLCGGTIFHATAHVTQDESLLSDYESTPARLC